MMERVIISVILALATSAAFADMRPPQRSLQPVTDPTMVIDDRGSKLEVFPTQRATESLDSSGRTTVQNVTHATASAPIGPHQLGVVFNHSMQAWGYISGEIAFKVKGGHAFAGSPSLYPGLKEITSPAVYVVNARTPVEFIKILKRLQARKDLEWVEPTVTYSARPPVNAAQ